MLAEGRVDLARGEVAERSGVSRTTIYRWWPTAADLLREVLAAHTRRLDVPDTGSWSSDVYALITQLAAFFSDRIERAQNSVMASGLHPEFNAFLLDYYMPIVEAWQHVVQRGIDRGEVNPDVNPSAVVSMITSPLLVITVLERRDPTPAAVRDIAELIIRATAIPSGQSRGKADRPRSRTAAAQRGRRSK
jgi:AcrR family transcriptional regulator